MPKISIIIPVYNVAPYLRKCLDSVLSQTLTDIEIICINDASTDESPKILQEYADKNPHIKFINFPANLGVSVARNQAIDIATGEYIGFVDSDDWIAPDFYEKLYQTAKKNQAELVIGNLKEISATTGEIITAANTIHHIESFRQKKIAFNQLFLIGLYQTSLLKKHHIYFIEGINYAEDRLFPLQAACYANKICYVEDAYYFYFRRPNSATMQKISYQMAYGQCLATDKIFDFINTEKAISKEDYIYTASTFLAELQYIFSIIDDDSYNRLHPMLQKICSKINEKELENSFQFKLLQIFLNHPQNYEGRRNWGKNMLAVLRNNHRVAKQKNITSTAPKEENK